MFKMKPHAMNAAKKAGLDPNDPENVFKGDDGFWHVRSTVPPTEDTPVATPTAPAASLPAAASPSPIATGVAFPDRRAPVPSNPIAFMRHILATVPFPDRKSAVEFFVSQGINEGTARTQYQRWRSRG